jgi:hypothetical protein
MSFLTCSFDGLHLASTRLVPPSERPKGSRVRRHFGQEILWLDYCDESLATKNTDRSDGDAASKNAIDDKTNGCKHSKPCGRHLAANLLEPYRLQGDEPMDNILRLLDEEGKRLQAGEDLLDRIDEVMRLVAHDRDDKAKNTQSTFSPSQLAMIQFHKKYSKIPTWVDLKQIKAGQEVFCAYAGSMALSLFYRSLVPGFSLPKIASVLEATRYLAPPSTREQVTARLTDTGAMLAVCARNHDSVLPGGDGWKTTLRVRVLHAKVRKALLANKQWNRDELGVPINQEDMAATLLAFSSNAMLGIEMILGFPLSQREQLAYLAYWRYLGWLLGVPTEDEYEDNIGREDDQFTTATTNILKLRPIDPCGPGWLRNNPDPLEHSKAIFASIIFHLMHPNDRSVKIAHHLLGVGYKNGQRDKQTNGDTATSTATVSSNSNNNWFYYKAIQCRRFIGDPLADALQLPKRHPHWWTNCLLHVAGYVYLVAFRCYTWACLPYSPLRRPLVRLHKRQLNRFIEAYWKLDHSKRMVSKSKHHNNGQSVGKMEPKPSSMCPFAMVSPPYSNLDDDNDKTE